MSHLYIDPEGTVMCNDSQEDSPHTDNNESMHFCLHRSTMLDEFFIRALHKD